MRIKNLIFFPFLVLFCACIQFKPEKIPTISVPFIEKIVICTHIKREGNWAYPKGEREAFIKGKDKRIYCFLSIKEIEGEHFLEWKWYDPKNNVYRATKKIKIGEEGQYFEKFVAWDGIFLFKEKESGKWKVAVFLDEKLIEAVEFEIK
jgi:hypothetical protein